LSPPSLIPPVILLILYLYLSFLSIIFLPFSLRPLYPSLYIPSFLPSSSYLSVVPSSTWQTWVSFTCTKGRSLYHSKVFFPSFPPTSLSVLTQCSCLP
jgi:hypothetical protein